MKVLLIFLFVFITKTEVLKGNIYGNQCGCEINILSKPFEYTQFNQIAYSQYLTDQISLFHNKWVHYISKVQHTDENIFGLTIESLSSLTLDAETKDGKAYKLVQQMPKNYNENYDSDQNREQLIKIQQYFSGFTEEERLKSKEYYFHRYFQPEMLQKNYIAKKLTVLLDKIQYSKKKTEDGTEALDLTVKPDVSLQQSSVAFKIDLTVNGLIGLQHMSFVLLHLVSFELRGSQYYFKDDVYYFEVQKNFDFNNPYDVDLGKAINIHDYIHDKENYSPDQPKKLDYINFYANPGLREVQQSCISSSSALRAGIGAALSNLIGFYYGNYNVCLSFSLMEDPISQQDKETFLSYVQNEANNIFGIQEKFHSSKELSFLKLDQQYRFPFVQNIFEQNVNNQLKQTLELYFDKNSDNSGQNFQFGCNSFKESFDYNIQNSKYAIYIHYIRGSNFVYINCDKSNHDIGYLIFRGKKIMKLFFTTYSGEDGSSETCFRSQFLMPQLLKSSLMCLKRPEKEQLQEIYDKNQSYLSFYHFYYKQPLEEIFNVTEILQDMAVNAINTTIVFHALLLPFFQKADKLQVEEQELIQQGSSDVNMPLLQYSSVNYAYQSKRGSLIDLSYVSNPLARLRVKLIEGEQEFLKLLFTDGTNEKEYLFSKFTLTDNVDIIKDFKKLDNSQNQKKKNIIRTLQQKYLPEITRYLQQYLNNTKSNFNKEVQSLQKYNYHLDVSSDKLMQIFSSLNFVDQPSSIAIAVYQLTKIRFKDTFLDKDIEDYLFEPMVYSQYDVRLEKDDNIDLVIQESGISYKEDKVKNNYQNIRSAFTFQVGNHKSEDQKYVRSFQYYQKRQGEKPYAYTNLQNFIEQLYQTESQSEWVYLKNKQELDKLSNDYFMYFDMEAVMVGYSLNEEQKKIFLESFVVGTELLKEKIGINFLLGNRQANRYLIVSFGGIETEYLKLLQITFYSIYFKSQFLIQLSDFQSIWNKIFDIIVSVASHYNQIAKQAYDMTMEGQDITMKDIEDLIQQEQQKFGLDLFVQQHVNQNTGDLDGITYLMPNSNLKGSGIPNETKDQKIVLTVSKKQFINRRKGYVIRFFDSKLPITEQANQQYVEQDQKHVQHGQLEFYNSYNFDYLTILSKFVEENLEKYQEKQLIQLFYKTNDKIFIFIFDFTQKLQNFLKLRRQIRYRFRN